MDRRRKVTNNFSDRHLRGKLRRHEPNPRQDGQTLTRRGAPPGRQNAGDEPVMGGRGGDFLGRGPGIQRQEDDAP